LITTLINKIKTRSFRHIGLYTAGTVVSKGISFLALPFFTFYISEAGFGILALITNSVLLLNSFILFSTNITLNADYFKKDKEAYNSLFTSFLAYVSGTTLASVCIIAVFFQPLQRNFGFQWYYIFLLPFLTFLNFFTEQLNNYLRLRHQSMTFFICNVLKAGVEVGLAILLLYVFRNDYHARIISIAASSFLFAVYAAYYFFVKMKLWGKFNIKLIQRELSFGVSIMIMHVANFLMGSSDKFFVKYFYTNELTGIYNIASTLAGVLFIFSSAISAYLVPNIYSSFSDDSLDKVATVKGYFTKYIIAIIGAAVLIFIAGTLIYFFLIKKTYLAGYASFCILLVGNIFYAVSLFFYPVLWYYRAKRKLVGIAAISLSVGSCLFYFLTKNYSIEGTSVALLLCYLVVGVYVSQLTIRLLKNMPTPAKDLG
jgi:O-antigen/teichoic acid export membrane protein